MRTNTPDSGFAVSSPEGSPLRLSTEEDERIKEKYFLNVEDNNSIQVEEEELWRRHPCQICSHVFNSNADYIAHGRIHFSTKPIPNSQSLLSTICISSTPILSLRYILEWV
ncbi:unnamed protein product [Lepeophtheirus salmonis]|uniref:(salmon louse) hypothetical protein n=1 Tax=Lepeophtheirus salmonis TaxID=72036 RepID=A0A7R8CT43_LEPSM|nr:unnamed protein product [Lepeophtheirus salmonis]CAF2922884.1 unnamed protein product [Lepeophtheirus salmonis]